MSISAISWANITESQQQLQQQAQAIQLIVEYNLDVWAKNAIQTPSDGIPRHKEIEPHPADDFIMTNGSHPSSEEHAEEIYKGPYNYQEPEENPSIHDDFEEIQTLLNKSIVIPPKPSLPPKQGMIPDIEYKRTDEEEKEYITLNESYIEQMSNIEINGIYSSIEGLAERSSFSSHKDDKADPQNENIKKIMKEIRKQLPQNIYTSINGSMYIRFDEDNPRFIQVLLMGIDDTPYESGLYLFDIYLCDQYPQKPLMIKHISKGGTLCHANNGPGGFSPNLHQGSGKVCLSLLGTWSGPGWDSGKSNTYQVISTIMFMIFGAKHPYYMEPGHGGWEGTVNDRKQHERRVIDYDEEVMYHNAKYTILETLKAPYVGFEDVIKTHFRLKSKWIIKTIERWMGNENFTDNFKEKMKPVLKEIKEEFEKLKEI